MVSTRTYDIITLEIISNLYEHRGRDRTMDATLVRVLPKVFSQGDHQSP